MAELVRAILRPSGMSASGRNMQNGIEAELRETAGGFTAHCTFCDQCFDHLMASVAARSVLLVGIPREEAWQAGRKPQLKAIPLPVEVDTERTRAEYAGARLLLTLEKYQAN